MCVSLHHYGCIAAIGVNDNGILHAHWWIFSRCAGARGGDPGTVASVRAACLGEYVLGGRLGGVVWCRSCGEVPSSTLRCNHGACGWTVVRNPRGGETRLLELLAESPVGVKLTKALGRMAAAQPNQTGHRRCFQKVTRLPCPRSIPEVPSRPRPPPAPPIDAIADLHRARLRILHFLSPSRPDAERRVNESIIRPAS